MEGELLPCPFCGGPGLEWKQRGKPMTCCDDSSCPGRDVLCTPEAWNRRSDRAGLIAGLRECAELADQWSEARLDEANAPIISGDVFTDGGVFVQSTADANAGYRLMDFAKSIRARIAALETEEGK